MTSHSIPWESLRTLLQHLLDALNAFSQLLGEEEAVMRRWDREKMQGVVEQKVQALETFHRYEREWVVLLRPWAPTGSAADCWKLFAQDPTFSVLNTHPLFHKITSLAQRIRDQGQRNAAMIRRGQFVVQEAMHLVHAGLGQGSVYQGTGTLRVQPVPSSVNIRG